MAEQVTIATFQNTQEAYITKGRLESEGIPCFILNEHTVSANPFYAQAIGGIRLNVASEDAETALAIIGDTIAAREESTEIEDPELAQERDTIARNNYLGCLAAVGLVAIAVLYLLFFK